MPGSLQNRLYRHEEMPPPAVWNNISRQLDEEFAASDNLLSEKLENAAISPPPQTWDKIAEALHDEIPLAENKRAKVIPIVYRRIAAAVIAAALLTVSVMYFYPSGNPQPALTSVTPQPSVVVPAKPKQDSFTSPPRDNAAVNAPSPIRRSTVASPIKRTLAYNTIRRSITSDQQMAQFATEEINEAPPSMLETVNDAQNIAISAPPIRDSRGNIIMDMRLITDPGNHYITITSPNGNPTRISNKFLKCLSYINNLSAAESDAEAQECLARFEEWRNKLLTEAAFVPAANNFFDIFELKDLLED